MLKYQKLILPFFCLALFLFYTPYLNPGVPAEDLPGHIALSEALLASLGHGQLFFYHKDWFAGWPAFSFYGFLPHLIAALISLPLSLFSAEPVELGVRLLAVLLCSLLPLSFYFASSQFRDREKEDNSINLVSIFACCFFSFWFLQHLGKFHGLGAGAILELGLFSQVFGWHLMLLHLGLLARATREPSRKTFAALVLVLVLSLTSHTLSAVFSAIWAGFWLIGFSSSRKILFSSHLLALGVVAFWALPLLVLSHKFASGDAYPIVGQFSDLFLHNPLGLAVLALLALGFVGTLLQRNVLQISFFLIFALVLLITSSRYIAANVPLGIHYYRFQGYLVLFLVVAGCFSSSYLLNLFRILARKQVLCACLVFFFSALSVFSYIFGSLERDRVISPSQATDYAELNTLLDFFAQNPTVDKTGRVFVEHQDDYMRTPFLSSHYLASKFPKRAGLETINGLFIESAPSNRFVSVSADILLAGTYHNYFVFRNNADLSPAVALAQLTSMGVRYFVAYSFELKRDMAKLGAREIFSTRRFRVFKVPSPPFQAINEVRKPLLGYLDLKGSLPFSFLSYYFYSRAKLYSGFEVIELEPGKPIPNGLSVLVANGEKKDLIPIAKGLKGTKFFPFLYSSKVKIDPFDRDIPVDLKIEKYRGAERFFEQNLKLAERLAALEIGKGNDVESTPKLSWDKNYSSFSLSKLKKNSYYKINYNYFPFWKASEGTIYRGLAEKILFYSGDSSEAELSYSYWNSKLSWIGFVLSLFSLATGFFFFFRNRNY